jgi:hypothetical protein
MPINKEAIDSVISKLVAMKQENDMREKYPEVSCLKAQRRADYTSNIAGSRINSRARYCDPAL